MLKEQLKFSDSSIGLLQAIYSFPNIVMVLIGGIIIDRIGTKRSTLLFGALCFLGAAVTAWPDVPAFGPLASLVTWLGSVFGFEVESRVLASMVAGRLIFGLGAESLIVAVTTAIARWFKGKELSFAFGMNLTIARFGSFAALNSPSWASESYAGWQLPLVISVGFATFCVVGAVLYWVLEASAERRYALGAAGPTDKVNFREVFSFSTSVLVHRRALHHVLLGHLPVPDVRREVLHRGARDDARDRRRALQLADLLRDGRARPCSACWWTGSGSARCS